LDILADYPQPRFINELLNLARGEQFLLLGGNNGFNKGQLLKHIACQLKAEGLEVKESVDITDYYSLSGAIEEEEKRCVIILYNLTPNNINFRIQELHSLIRKKDHIVLCSTEEHYDSWMFQEGITDRCWYPIPEKDIYSKDTLLSYLDAGLQKKNLAVPPNREQIIDRLSGIEQLDVFLTNLARLGGAYDHKQLMAAVESSVHESNAALAPWFYSLNNVNKLIVIGLSFFDGAYERQVFAGFERILLNAWKYRNEELRPIDYEDLIPLRYYFKTEGKLIQGITEQQRRTIFSLAWRTHKRYILSAIPVLLDIINDSAEEEKFDIDLFGFDSYRSRIRNVLSETLSDIAFHSFEDLNISLLSIARSKHLVIQLAAANAVSRWKIFKYGEEKIYEVLEMWQRQTAIRLSEIADGAKDDTGKQTFSNIGGTIALTLAYLSGYDTSNKLSPRITELLLNFLDNKEEALVDRIGYALEYIISRHPLSMKDYLKDKFLHNPAYIVSVAGGLVNAYHNGFSENVKSIITEWLDECKKLTGNDKDKKELSYREYFLATIILTLKYIDYHTETKTITIAETNAWLTQLRKTNQNIYIRGFLLDAIIYLVEQLFYNTGQVTTLAIANVDEEETRHLVDWFKNTYLAQREELFGGEYSVRYENRWFDSWYDPLKRPKTPVENLLNKWVNVEADNVLRQIALKAFNKFKEIEAIEKQSIDQLIKAEKNQLKNGNGFEKGPAVGEIQSTTETKAFTKICRTYIHHQVVELVEDFYKVAVTEKIDQNNIRPLVADLGNQDERTTNTIVFIYQLFRNNFFEERDSPALSTFQSTLFVTLASISTPSHRKKYLRAFAPMLFAIDTLDKEERQVIFKKIMNHHKIDWLKTTFRLTKNPVLFVPIIMVISYLLYQLLHIKLF